MTRPMKPNGPMTRRGFTLLEVILALAIMAGATAVLGELVRNGLLNAQAARDLTRGELVCESVMTQVVTGAISASAASNVQFDDDPRWLYSIAVESAGRTGLITVTVTVIRDAPAETHPVPFRLVRWMLDPNVSSSSSGTQAQTGGPNGGGT